MLDKEEAEMKEEEEKKSRPVVRLGMLELGKLVESLPVARWFRPEKESPPSPAYVSGHRRGQRRRKGFSGWSTYKDGATLLLHGILI